MRTVGYTTTLIFSWMEKWITTTLAKRQHNIPHCNAPNFTFHFLCEKQTRSTKGLQCLCIFVSQPKVSVTLVPSKNPIRFSHWIIFDKSTSLFWQLFQSFLKVWVRIVCKNAVLNIVEVSIGVYLFSFMMFKGIVHPKMKILKTFVCLQNAN